MDFNDKFYRDQVRAQLAVTENVAAASETKRERDLQAGCERWLAEHGYCRLTRENAMSYLGDKGCFGHLHEPKGNPFLPDLFLFATDGRYLFVELKVVEDDHHAIHYGPGQRQMIEAGWWKLATTEEEFAALVTEWEKKG